MWMSVSLARESNFKAEVKPATVYENRGDGHKDHADPTSHWLSIQAGVEMLSIRMTEEQMDRLYHQLGAYLRDADDRRANEQSAGAPPIDVIDPEQTMTAEEVKAGIKAGMQAEMEEREEQKARRNARSLD